MGETTPSVIDRANAVAEHILGLTDLRPRIALILGSGLGAFADSLEDAKVFPYTEIPGMHATTVPGHRGELVIGKCAGVDVLVMSGRFHYYEGHTMQEVTFPVRAMRQAGIRYLFVTNSSGGLNPDFAPGDLMAITDHINLSGRNPLLGANDAEFGPRFPDMTYAYAPKLVNALKGAAEELSIPLLEGVYVGLTGPSYETPAEVRMLGMLGGDAVGMSTVPEVIVANHCGLEVGGVSCIANLGAGLTPARLDHSDIKAAANESSSRFVNLLQGAIGRMKDNSEFDFSPLPGAIAAAG